MLPPAEFTTLHVVCHLQETIVQFGTKSVLGIAVELKRAAKLIEVQTACAGAVDTCSLPTEESDGRQEEIGTGRGR